jgi:hypothetical protein
MSRFYDVASTSELNRIEGLLKLHGIEFTVRSTPDYLSLINEIFVAEEDMAFAEKLIDEFDAIAK